MGMLLSIGWLFTEGLFPPTRSSALTISQFQRRNRTGERPVYQESLISFNIRGRRFLPGPHTMWGVLKPGAPSRKFGGRFMEANTMLGHVALCLLWIPLEVHESNISG